MPLKYISKFQLKPGTWVFVPNSNSIEKGKSIKSSIEKKWKAPKNYFHLRKGGHVEALKSHLNNSSFIHLDIENFFGSINKSRVTRCLTEFFPYNLAREMTNDSIEKHPQKKNYILPFGFVQSPIIASLCLDKSGLGTFLKKLSNRTDIVVSVYVDDIIISAKDHSVLADILISIKNKADKAGFHLNEKKEEGPSIKITAFNIELSEGSVFITTQRMQQLKESFEQSESDHQKNGILGYIQTVNELQKNDITLIPNSS